MSSVATLPAGVAGKPGAWALRGGDLPAERLRLRTPEFADIGENVVYRALLMRHHQRGRWARLHPALRGIVLAVGIFFASLLMTGLLPLLIILAVFSRNRTGTLAAGLRLPEALTDELVDLPIAPREWTVALWSFSTTSKGRSAAPFAVFFYLCGMALAVGALMLGFEALPPEGVATLAGLAGFAAGMGALLVRPPAEAYLPGLAVRMRQLRRILLRRGNPVALVLGLLLTIVAVFFGMGIVTFAITLFFGSLMTAPGMEGLLSGAMALLAGWLVQPAAPYANFLLGAAISGGLLALYRRRVMRRRGLYLERIDGEIARILEEARARRDGSGAKAGAGMKPPRAALQPAARP